ncbi:probable myosin-binding protein 5 isoform X2 [Phragmites australis]|uniref:probable myosin-binding protein 5 isoform X2 n=1 Tax=Phragmites australis TaxID=29695 RepID=UPI002D797D40|nr:probable myosin-binding protein 5 isoform X2 [Phragmites australis]
MVTEFKPMAPRTSAGKPWRTQQFSALLSSAFLEWVLMLLLLLEGLISYLVTAFARLCKLQPPCPMCTRLDHVLGKEQPGFYRDLMCNSHKAEASSWAFCHIHQKLVDVHSMCEACLLSFATDKKSNLQTYRSLVGKLGLGIGNVCCNNNYGRNNATEAPFLTEDTLCSCCSRPLKVKSYSFLVLQSKASGIGIEEICRDVSRDQCIDEINYVAYSELKTSDSESEPWQVGGNVGSLLKDDADNLKEGFGLDHPLTKNADDIPPYDNSQEKIHEQSESILVQNGDSDNMLSENSGELCNIQADGKAKLHSTDLPVEDCQKITEDFDRRDKSEDDVWHNALSSTEKLSVAAKSAETDTIADENKAEFTHRTTRKNSFKVHEDLKLLLSQLSTSSHAPDTDSPTVQDQREKAILHNITRALSLERNYTGISESMVNEVEVECTIDQLKRQIELDRQSISRLWKELEEERNASAVAANQTMAMITRLQEEKAAMQMEALQYKRMMEEQSEYDREDLQKMSETVQTLQAETESYKTKLRDQLLVDEIRDHMRLSCPREHESSISRTTKSLSGFEDEKAYISKRLRKLRQKLHQFSNNSNHISLPKPSDYKENSVDDTNSDDAYEDADDLVFDKHLGRNGDSLKDSRLGKDDPKGQYHAMVSDSEKDLACFEDEISEVSGRLKALEADRSFLEHSVNSLRNGKEGEELIRDVASSLRELRKMGITWKEYD